MTVDCVLQKFNQAKMRYHIPEGMILHTDLDSQYTEIEVERWLETNKIRHSYSRKGTPYDNAGIKSFHASLKKKKYTRRHIQTSKKRIYLYLTTLKDFIIEF